MIFLIRHAMVDACGRFLAGRLPGIHLNVEGRAQAAQLAKAFAGRPLQAVYSSPLERARETASMIAPPATVHISEEWNEIEFGQWTGASFRELGARRDWLDFNRRRSCYPIPGGESLTAVQDRASEALTGIADVHGSADVAIVSHGDVLRALIVKLFGLPLEQIDAFALEPGSISSLVRTAYGFQIAGLNQHACCSNCCASHH